MPTRTDLGVPARLGIYGAVLVAVFIVAFFLAGALVPGEYVERWQDRTETHHTHSSAAALGVHTQQDLR